MATRSEQAEQEARRYLAAASEEPTASPEDYQRALRKATASIERLQRAVRMAERTEESR